MKRTEFAALWRQKMEQPSPTVELEFSGLRGEFRRLPLQGWIKSGRVPQFLVHAMLEAQRAGQAAEPFDESQFSNEQFDEAINFQRDAVCYVAVNPRIVAEDRPLEDGEISYAELAEKDPTAVDEIAAWVMLGCPDVPVRMKDGEVTLADVEKFRKGGKKRTASKPRSNVQAVQSRA
jgi:hypothetical protein